ncbi:MAG: hypothetical protein WBG41_11500, partial [Acidimicrobiales bacterium]
RPTIPILKAVGDRLSHFVMLYRHSMTRLVTGFSGGTEPSYSDWSDSRPQLCRLRTLLLKLRTMHNMSGRPTQIGSHRSRCVLRRSGSGNPTDDRPYEYERTSYQDAQPPELATVG